MQDQCPQCKEILDIRIVNNSIGIICSCGATVIPIKLAPPTLIKKAQHKTANFPKDAPMTPQQLLDTLRLITFPLYKSKPIARTDVNGLTISTVYTGDLGVYETAIGDQNGFYPVQRYNTSQEATEGHQHWINKSPNLVIITKLGFGSIIADEQIVLQKLETIVNLPTTMKTP